MSLPPAPASPAPLIIDTDPGIDDILAILLALAHPERARLEAITLNFGNTTLDHERSNILRLFHVLHQHVAEDDNDPARRRLKDILTQGGPEGRPILLSHGAPGPLGGQRFSASYFHGRDGISGVSSLPGDPYPVPAEVPSPLLETEKHASDVILDILRKHPPGTVRIAAIGPLTNVALAWQKDPKTFLRVAGISVMGCALDVPGNTTPCAEFNTYADPFAAHLLLHEARAHPLVGKSVRKRLPIDLLPLDVTSMHVVPFSRLCDGVEAGRGILRRFIAAILASPRKVTQSFAPPGQPFDASRDDLFTAHDPLAVAHAIFAPAPMDEQRRRAEEECAANGDSDIEARGWHTRARHFDVETQGALTRGFCVVDRRQHGNSKPGQSRVEKDDKDNATEDRQENGIKAATAQAQGVDHPATSAKREDNGVSSNQSGSGVCDAVISSPGIEWFADVFCRALGV